MPIKYKPAPCSHEELRARYDYDPETGVLLNRVIANYNAKSGAAVGSVERSGYLATKIRGNTHKVHRLVWFWFYGDWPPEEMDHIDGNRRNNKITNLRLASRAENVQNFKRYNTNKTGLTGVSLKKRHKDHHACSKPYRATIRRNGVRTHIGYFETAAAAHAAYLAVRAEMFSFQPVPREAP